MAPMAYKTHKDLQTLQQQQLQQHGCVCCICNFVCSIQYYQVTYSLKSKRHFLINQFLFKNIKLSAV